MALIKCPECGKEISDLAEKCPNCGFPIKSSNAPYPNMPSSNHANVNMPNNVNANPQQSYVQPIVVKPYQPESKNSKLGLAALILSILGCTFWLGIILAIIDLCKKDGSKKVCSIVAICVSVFWLVLAVSVGRTENDSSTQNTGSMATTSTVSTQNTSESGRQIEENEAKDDEENEVATEQQNEWEDYIEITSSELIDTYNENQVKCKQLYDGKKLMVTGSVLNVGTDILNQVYVCLDHDTEYVFVGIQCYAKDNETENKIAELKEGDVITVIGNGECGSLSFAIKDAEILSVQEQSGLGSSVENDSSMTTGQRNALKSANSYLDFSAFSYDGLISQLEFEEYSHEDAVFAADNCGADWNEQAARAAKTYLEFTSFSKDGLIEQLEFEGFTHEQAVYGAEANGY